MAKTSNEGAKEKAGSGNPPKNLKKVSKNLKEITARMLVRALNRIPAVQHKDGEGGHSLAAIRKYLRDHHGLWMDKGHQELLKAVMRKQYRRGTITMVNGDGPSIIFTKRFEVASDIDESEMDDGDASSSDENEE